MKNVLFILLFSITFLSCKKDDSPTSHPLVGEWEVIKVSEYDRDIELTECYKKRILSISDKKFIYYFYFLDRGICKSEVFDFEYIIEDNKVIDKKKDRVIVTFSLMENNTRLRVDGSYTWAIFKRK